MPEYMCPHCGETVETDVDLGGGESQEYVEDCQVCCRPNRLWVHIGEAGDIEVEVGEP
jgi:hypothetical protein